MMENDASSATEARLRAKNARLRTKVKDYRIRLSSANSLIQQLQEHNLYLQRTITEHISQITSLKIQLETQDSQKTSSKRHKSFPRYSSKLLPPNLRYHEDISLYQSHAGSNDSASTSASSNPAQEIKHRRSLPRPASPSHSTASTSEHSPNTKTPSAERKVRFKLEEEQLKSSSEDFAASMAGSASSGQWLSTEAERTTTERGIEFDPEDIEMVMNKLKAGDKLSEEDLTFLFELWTEDSPELLNFIRHQTLAPSSSNRKNGATDSLNRALRQNGEPNGFMGSMPTASSTTIDPSDSSSQSESRIESMEELAQDAYKDCLISFQRPTDSSTMLQAYPTSCSSFELQWLKIRFENITSTPLSFRVYTFASSGSFLGFAFNKSLLHPSDLGLLELFLVGNTQSPLSISLAILEVIPNIVVRNGERNSSSGVKEALPESRYYFFGSKSEMKPNPSVQGWKVPVDRLASELEHQPIVKTPLNVVCRAKLLGAPVTSRRFVMQDSLADMASFDHLVSLLTNPLLAHHNISSLIGVARKRPFRIISQHWSCTLSTSLRATISSRPPAKDEPSASSTHHGIITFNVKELWERHAKAKIPLNDKSEVPILASLLDRVLVAQDILAALTCLHNANFIHRDLSTNSIGMVHQHYSLMVEMGSVLDLTAPKFLKFLPSTSWVAPEIKSIDKHTKESDIYAFGVLLMDLAVGAPLSIEIGSTRSYTFDQIFQQWQASISLEPTHNGERSTSKISAESSVHQPPLGSSTAETLLCRLIELCCHPQPLQRPSLATISAEIDKILSFL
jgi:hypothetical protein